MVTFQRRSPVIFSARPAEVEQRDHWNVVLAYEKEGNGPYLIDLSHRNRWDLQSGDIDTMTPWGVPLPLAPGDSNFNNGVLINRMNRTQVSIWHLIGKNLEPPDSHEFTDVTEATLFLALTGQHVFTITEKLTNMDLLDPKRSLPFLLQGPFSHVPCQIVVLANRTENAVVLLACSRGYGHSMVEALFEAGEEFKLRPAGENRFKQACQNCE